MESPGDSMEIDRGPHGESGDRVGRQKDRIEIDGGPYGESWGPHGERNIKG